jgi:hypothetical protein
VNLLLAQGTGAGEAADLIVNLRASALPLAFACPGSIRATDLRINNTNEQAANGSAGHKLLEHLVVDGAIQWERVNEISDMFGADDQEVRMLCGKAARLWPKIRDSFPRALTEVAVDRVLEIGGLRITGHIDLISVSGDVARIGDWKCGRLDSPYVQQLKAYGAMVLLKFPQLREATVTALWLRTEEIENYHMTQADAESWSQSLVDTVVQWDGVYRPSTKNCQYCPRNHECPAANVVARRDLAAIADVEPENLEAIIGRMPAEQIIDIMRKAKSVQKLAERAQETIRAHVVGGGIVEANGVRLAVETEERRELDPLLTWGVLEKDFGFVDADFAAVVKLGPTRVEDRVRRNAGKGYGAAAVRNLRTKLELAGAIGVREIQKVTERRV